MSICRLLLGGLCLLCALPAFAVSIEDRSDLGLYGADAFFDDVDFVAQARIGQPFNHAQTELSLGYDTDSPAEMTEAHFPWEPYLLEPFTLAFDGAGLTLDVDGAVLTWNDSLGQVDGNALFIRMRSTRVLNGGNGDGETTTGVFELEFTQGATTPLGIGWFTNSVDGPEYLNLTVTGVDLSQPWELRGYWGLGWDGAIRPAGYGSDPAIQIKGGYAEPEVVPEPASMMMLGLGLGGLALSRMRRRKTGA